MKEEACWPTEPRARRVSVVRKSALPNPTGTQKCLGDRVSIHQLSLIEPLSSFEFQSLTIYSGRMLSGGGSEGQLIPQPNKGNVAGFSRRPRHKRT